MTDEEVITSVPPDLGDDDLDREDEDELTFLGTCPACEEPVYSEDGSHTVPAVLDGRGKVKSEQKVFHPGCHDGRQEHDKAVKRSKRRYDRRAREAARRAGAVG